MDDALRERVDALERAVTDGDCELTALTEDADALRRLEAVETQLNELEDRVAELEAATQALRGYVGNIRSVNRDVEQRADAALAKANEVAAALNGENEQADISTETPAHTNAANAVASSMNASADGGATRTQHHQQETGGEQQCENCGRPHDGSTQFDWGGTETTANHGEQSITDRTDRESNLSANGQSIPEDTAEEEFPETTEEIGTLQRVREML